MTVRVFPTPEEARFWAIQPSAIQDEIYRINMEILSAVNENRLVAYVHDSFMTMPGTSAARYYYDVWSGNIVDDVVTEQMNRILRYYENQGYTIDIVQNISSLDTFVWVVRW